MGNSKRIKLIELYPTHIALWDMTSKFYYVMKKKRDTKSDISEQTNILAA